MVGLNEAIEKERARRKQVKDAAAAKRASAMQALRIFAERCAEAALPNWEFQFSDGKLSAVHHQGSRGYSKQAHHSWWLDEQNRITDGREATSPVDSVGAAKAVDEAVQLLAKRVLDADEPDG